MLYFMTLQLEYLLIQVNSMANSELILVFFFFFFFEAQQVTT